MTPEQKEEIRRIVQDEFQKNYLSGVPQIAPHTHNGVDNLPVNASDLSGSVVNSIVAGTNVTISPSTGTGNVTVNATGGSGSPGGNDTNVQFNDAGNFGGVDTFEFDSFTNTLILDDAGVGSGDIITGGNSNLNIVTGDKTDGSGSGGINLLEGGDSGSGGFTNGIIIIGGTASASDGTPGQVLIQAGDSGGIGTFPFLGNGTMPGGNVSITSGNTGNSTSGNITLTTGNARNSGTVGLIKLVIGKAGNVNGYVSIMDSTGNNGIVPNIFIGRTADTPSFGSGNGVIEMRNRTTVPSTNPTNGGLIYIEAGALMYRGSAGTVTTLAPA